MTKTALPAAASSLPTTLVGAVFDWPGPVVPSLYLECYGQAVNRTTYSALFAALVALKGTVTVTLASPGVFTFAGHGLVIGDPVFFTTTGALPTGLSANTQYYVMTVPDTNTFTVGTTRTVAPITGLAPVTTAVNTSVSQSGVHTLYYAPYGISSSTTFLLPDYRGKVSIALDNAGGSDAAQIPWANILGLAAGEGAHTLLAAESGLPSHGHNIPGRNDASGAGNASVQGSAAAANWDPVGVADANSANAASSHNLMQPSIAVKKIIYAGV